LKYSPKKLKIMALNLSKNDGNTSQGNGGEKKLNLNLEKKEIQSADDVKPVQQPEDTSDVKSKNSRFLAIFLILLLFGAGIFVYQSFFSEKTVAESDNSIVDSSSNAQSVSNEPDSNKQESNQAQSSNIAATQPDSSNKENSVEASKENLSGSETSKTALVNLISKNEAQVASFSAGSVDVSGQDQQKINLIVAYLNEKKSNRVTILGFSSSEGDLNQNQSLSQNRAKSFKSILVSLGVDPQKINVKGMGIENPIADNSTIEGRQKNRRVEFVLE
jgi:outer membrane protein OmpA-like peptidoglycan-associated protein